MSDSPQGTERGRQIPYVRCSEAQAIIDRERERAEKAEAERDIARGQSGLEPFVGEDGEKYAPLTPREQSWAASAAVNAKRADKADADLSALREGVEGAVADCSCECDPGYCTRQCLVCKLRALLPQRTVDCPNCDNGVILGVEPECCGNTTSSGECRGDCAVPRPVEEQCPACCGEGQQPAGSPAETCKRCCGTTRIIFTRPGGLQATYNCPDCTGQKPQTPEDR